MFNSKVYVPILKWKRGEQKALEQLDNTIKSKITPLIEIVPIPYDYANDCYQKTIEDHLYKIGEQIENSWIKDKPIYLDLYLLNNEKMSDGSEPLDYILADTRARNLKVIPVTSPSRSLEYQKAVKNAIEKDKLGVCIRLEDTDLLDLQSNLDDIMNNLSVTPKDVDLIIDYKYINPSDNKKNIISIISIINIIPYINAWRTLTFSASSFPENMSIIESNATTLIPRSEWHIWMDLYNHKNKLKRLPQFSDYAIANPIYTEVDPRIMQMSANIRYTTNNEFVILKGKSVRNYGWEQINDLCKNLISLPEYCGSNFSWGDKYIYDCANNSVSTGNAETWRRVGTNHHITFVVNQLSNLSYF